MFVHLLGGREPPLTPGYIIHTCLCDIIVGVQFPRHELAFMTQPSNTERQARLS